MKRKKVVRKKKPLNIVFLGIQGSGKGTQAGLLAKRLRLPVVPVGDLYRKEIAAKTPEGLRALRYIKKGRLAPDTLTNAIVRKHLRQLNRVRRSTPSSPFEIPSLRVEGRSRGGVILDGYPRNLVQARALARMLKIGAAIHLEMPESLVMARLSGRRVCEKCGATYHNRWARPKRSGVCDRCRGRLIQRADDTPAAIRKRIEIFRTATQPVVNYYAKLGVLMVVDGAHPIPTVHRELLHRLKGAWI